MWNAALFGLFVIVCVALDVGYGRKRALTRTEAWALSLFWLLMPLMFGLGLHLSGSDLSLPFFSSFIVAKSLTLDNIIVIAILFSYFRSSNADQEKLLNWALISALIFRGLFIGLAEWALDLAWWVPYIFGALLLFSSCKLLLVSHRRIWPSEVPRLPTFGFSLVSYHILFATLLFTLDAIPATLAVTNNATVMVSANLFAVLGMRAFYYAVISVMGQYRFLKGSLGILLAILGISVLSKWDPSPGFILVLTLSLVSGSLLLSRLTRGWGPPPLVSPLEHALEEAAVLTLSQARRLIVTIVGLSVLVIGILMIFLPGPAIVFVPLGLIILSAEWAWARRLLQRFTPKK